MSMATSPFSAVCGILFCLLAHAAPLHAQESLTAWPFFYRLMDTENLAAVIWAEGETEESFRQYAIIAPIPDWVQESSAQRIESKTTATTFTYWWIPYTYRSFCQQYDIDPATLKASKGAALIDLGAHSQHFTPIDLRLLERIKAHLASWEKQDDWIIHPRPEPEPPSWLGKPLNRKFYYELRD